MGLKRAKYQSVLEMTSNHRNLNLIDQKAKVLQEALDNRKEEAAAEVAAVQALNRIHHQIIQKSKATKTIPITLNKQIRMIKFQ